MVVEGGMSAVELPEEPARITQDDLEALKVLRLKHEQELREYEEETRRQRKELRSLKRELAKKGAGEKPIVERTQDVTATAEHQLAEERARVLERDAQAEREKAEREQFELEKARLEERLAKTRKRIEQEEASLEDEEKRALQVAVVKATVVGGADGSVEHNVQRISRACSEANSFCTAEDPLSAAPSAVPSCSPSVASSAAPSAAPSAVPSRSSSPTSSDTTSRCPVIPIVEVGAAVDAVEKQRRANEESTPAVASTAPTPRKGKGKGKGPAPPPNASTPRLSLPDRSNLRPSRFVNLYWKATQKPETVDPEALKSDPFLARLRDPAPVHSDMHIAQQNPSERIFVPALPQTVFTAGLEVAPCPDEMLEAYFKRSEAAVKLPQVDNPKQSLGVNGRINHLGDQKRLNMIGIMLQKHVMQHKEESNREAILNIKRGVLQCDFNVVKLECLSVIRTVLRQHVRDGSPLSSYVLTHGEAAIWDLAYPDHHYLVHELSKVPQIDERLECMLFKLGFDENLTICNQNLETLFKALGALRAKRDLIRRFFVTAHRLGQSLSQKQSRGFQLSTLEKLPMTKSTKMPSLSILHFVLALMSSEDAQELFTAEDISLLRGAKVSGTAKVCDDCRELAQGLYGVKQICESGEYRSSSTGQSVKMQRRRKTLDPQAAAAALHGMSQEPQEPAIDTDDCFHEVMHKFVDENVDKADDIVVECHKMLLFYKELALFFDDLNNVYPPPKDPADKKLDLVDVFYRFAKVVPQHRQEVEDEGLRAKVGRE